jgi:hypothetical protein
MKELRCTHELSRFSLSRIALQLRNSPGLFAFVWIFSLVFWLFQDVCKVLCFKWMAWTNFNGVMSSGVVVLPESTLKMIKRMENEPEMAIRVDEVV